MNLKFLNKELDQLIGKFLEGGVAPEPTPTEEAPAAPELAGGSPEELIMQAAAQAVENLDGNLALQVCQALVQMRGGGAPAEPETQPVYKKGGVLSRRIPRNK